MTMSIIVADANDAQMIPWCGIGKVENYAFDRENGHLQKNGECLERSLNGMFQ